jgi:hypothetical protein
MRLLVDVTLDMAGELDAELAGVTRRRAAAYVEDARRRGDVLMVSQALIDYAYTLSRGDSPAAAVAAATEASRIAEAFGVGYLAATAGVNVAYSLVAMAVSGAGDRATAARHIRHVITEYRDRHTMASVLGVLDPLATLLSDYEAHVAYLLHLASQRMWATGTPLPANAVDALDPATVAELDQRANAMGADEAVALALDALERYLDTIDPR